MPRTIQPSTALCHLLAQQDGVATTQQLTDNGFSRRAVDNRIQRGRWRRLLPGVVLTLSGAATRRQALIAAWLWGGAGAAIDGADACAWYGLKLDTLNLSKVHIVVPADSTLRSRQFVVVRRAVSEITIGATGLVPYVDAATAVVVAARNAPSPREAIATLSRALQAEVTSVAQLAVARESIGDKWCRQVDSALIAVGVGMRSPAENDNRRLILTSTVLPEPRWNVWLQLPDSGAPVCVDALWEDAGLVQEVIGRRYHAWGQQFEDTEARRARLLAAGLVVAGVTPTQIRRNGAVALGRLEQTYALNAGRGMPAGVFVIAHPQSRDSDALWAVSRD